MNEIKMGIQIEVQWRMLFLDDIVLIGESFEEGNSRFMSGGKLSKVKE